MSKLWDEIAAEWDGIATSSSTAFVIVTGGALPTPAAQPWLNDPRYGGMSPESARRSWLAAQESTAQDNAVPRLRWIDMSRRDDERLPQRKWAIKDRVPLNQAGLFSGEGGTGKSIIELTKNCAHVLGKDWLGSLPEPGPAFYFGAEDDEDELHIRIAAIASHYGVSFKELVEGGLHVCCLLGEDAILWTRVHSWRGHRHKGETTVPPRYLGLDLALLIVLAMALSPGRPTADAIVCF